jgi:NADPH:quinone reductase-like Zn-dependent oxidoreductase
MRAAVQREYGDPGVLQLEDAPDPVVRDGWTIVRLRAAALNWHDVLVRRGQYESPLPHVPGADGAGVVVETGDEVVVLPSLWWGNDESAPGKDWEILGDHRYGTHAELVAVPDECVFPKPEGLSWAEAAALPLVGVTTYRALFSRAGLKPGESLLVLGAGGGVATMAVSLASAAGAHVFVTSSSDTKIKQACELGASDGVHYDDARWPEAARDLSGGRGFDVVLDSVGTWSESLRALRPGGRLVVLGASRADQAQLAVRPYYFAQQSILGTTMGSPADFAGLLRLIEDQDVPPPVIDTVFPLDQVVAAHERLESGQAFGKLVLEV